MSGGRGHVTARASPASSWSDVGAVTAQGHCCCWLCARVEPVSAEADKEGASCISDRPGDPTNLLLCMNSCCCSSVLVMEKVQTCILTVV